LTPVQLTELKAQLLRRIHLLVPPPDPAPPPTPQ